MDIHEIQQILSGTGAHQQEDTICTVVRYLRAGSPAGDKIEGWKNGKQEEEAGLIRFIPDNKVWYNFADHDKLIGEGTEQKVFLLSDGITVLKINDAVFCNSWNDYFESLLLHNYFFSATAYNFLGFAKMNNVLYSVVTQSFVVSTEPTDIDRAKRFMEFNGFINKKQK